MIIRLLVSLSISFLAVGCGQLHEPNTAVDLFHAQGALGIEYKNSTSSILIEKSGRIKLSSDLIVRYWRSDLSEDSRGASVHANCVIEISGQSAKTYDNKKVIFSISEVKLLESKMHRLDLSSISHNVICNQYSQRLAGMEVNIEFQLVSDKYIEVDPASLAVSIPRNNGSNANYYEFDSTLNFTKGAQSNDNSLWARNGYGGRTFLFANGQGELDLTKEIKQKMNGRFEYDGIRIDFIKDFGVVSIQGDRCDRALTVADYRVILSSDKMEFISKLSKDDLDIGCSEKIQKIIYDMFSEPVSIALGFYGYRDEDVNVISFRPMDSKEYLFKQSLKR